jgi:hypothetical protein
MALWQAIETYHELLTDSLGAESQGQLDEQQRRRGLFFGDRPLTTVLRPRFLAPEQYHFLQGRVRLVMRAFNKAYQRAIADPAFRAQFALTDWEEQLVALDPGYANPHPTSRLDAFFVTGRGGLRFMEFNGEVPAAPAYNDVLSELFLGLPIMREFLRTHEVRMLPARHSTMHALIDAYQQWLGRHERPRIAILDWREVPTYSEFVLFEDYFKSQGYECRIVDPREVEYRNGKLVAGDYTIDLIYKRVLISELVLLGGIDHPVVRAVADRAVCMVNPFRCKILHKKASLAVLSDERNADLFTPEERETIDVHIPWTRRVEDRTTVHNGQPVDLLPYIAKYRENLVLKANDEYGGKGVYLGWETSPEEWEATIQQALSEPFVVQERVELTSEPYPSLVDGKVQVYDRMQDTNPYVFYGDYMDGCLTRISTQALLNVTAGGGSTVPTFLVEQRD